MRVKLKCSGGHDICGTLEKVSAVALTYTATVGEDGSLEPEYAGQSLVDWDSQETCRGRDGGRLFVCSQGEHHHEADLVREPIGEETQPCAAGTR